MLCTCVAEFFILFYFSHMVMYVHMTAPQTDKCKNVVHNFASLMDGYKHMNEMRMRPKQKENKIKWINI